MASKRPHRRALIMRDRLSFVRAAVTMVTGSPRLTKVREDMSVQTEREDVQLQQKSLLPNHS